MHQDDAPAHKSVVAMVTVRDCDSELVNHRPNSPDMASPEYFLFPSKNTQKTLGWEAVYRTDDEVVSAVEDCFEDQDENFYTSGIQALQHRWKKCVERWGDYVEK